MRSTPQGQLTSFDPCTGRRSKGRFHGKHSFPSQRIQVLQHLVEGNTIRSTTRLTGVNRDTIANLLVSFGARCAEFMDRKFRGLHLDHIEIDEIWTFVQKKQARLTVDEKAERSDIGDVYLWTSPGPRDEALPVVPPRQAVSR